MDQGKRWSTRSAALFSGGNVLDEEKDLLEVGEVHPTKKVFRGSFKKKKKKKKKKKGEKKEKKKHGG